MGFGHRVYKNYDPRARIIKKHVDEVLEATGGAQNPKLEIAQELEKRALDDDYFTERKLYPNVDFYSGLIYEALNIPSGHVHGDVRHPAHRRLAGAVAGDARRPGEEDRASPADLHRATASSSTADRRSAAERAREYQTTSMPRASQCVSPARATAQPSPSPAARRGCPDGRSRSPPAAPAPRGRTAPPPRARLGGIALAPGGALVQPARLGVLGVQRPVVVALDAGAPDHPPALALLHHPVPEAVALPVLAQAQDVEAASAGVSARGGCM